MTRSPEFDLAKELARPSFTPGARDAAALVELIVGGDEAVVTRAAPALAGLRDPARVAILARLDAVPLEDGAASRLVHVLGLLARGGDLAARIVLIARLQDPVTRVRRAAAVALGKLATVDGRATATPPDRRAELEDIRDALVARWDATGVTPDERRALAEALGKVGGEEALARLHALDPSADKELSRRRDRAVLMADRTARRGEDSTIATDLAPAQPLSVRLGCRPGLGELLYSELVKLDLGGSLKTQQRTDAVDVTLTKPWSALFASRLWATASIRMPLAVQGDGADAIARAIVAAVTGPAIGGLMRAWTRGPIRWRLQMAKGHQRAVVWNVAKEVTRIAPDLINDPTATTWEIEADPDERMIELVPRRFEDPRFAYRDADVPAASHPTVAAALAWVAEPRAGDRVWDPFCGSGIELIERARRGPYRALIGSDLEEAALAAARTNLASAGVSAALTIADARTYAPGPIDLILTNPPLGSRVRVDAVALLVATLPGFAQQLTRGGRLVWITPSHRQTTPVAEAAGLVLARSLPVDLGGVRGRLERWDKR